MRAFNERDNLIEEIKNLKINMEFDQIENEKNIAAIYQEINEKMIERLDLQFKSSQNLESELLNEMRNIEEKLRINEKELQQCQKKLFEQEIVHKKTIKNYEEDIEELNLKIKNFIETEKIQFEKLKNSEENLKKNNIDLEEKEKIIKENEKINLNFKKKLEEYESEKKCQIAKNNLINENYLQVKSQLNELENKYDDSLRIFKEELNEINQKKNTEISILKAEINKMKEEVE